MFKLLKFLFIAFLASAAAAAVAGYSVWQRMHEPFKGFAAEEQFVEIPSGSSTADIARRLSAAGVIDDETSFRTALWWSGQARSLKAGEYRFTEPSSPLQVIDRLARGDVFTRRITFPEGLTILDMARLYEQREFGTAAEFVEAAADETLIADLDPQATDLEGYLFPETYALPRGTPASRLVAAMVDRFKATYTAPLREQAAAQGFTTRQVVALASLIEKETGQAEERPLVAAVYRNRLEIGMGMQADPTVVYALQQAGRYDGNIRREDLQFDSPYNTYRYAGLPPGPIAAPGKASLEAALAPADVPYLYFVSRNDGSHVFSTTLAEHNRNVQRYQVEFFREQRRRRAQGG
ncbi:MAG: endolytic transglycosylase MltG [Vicinamibacterales bacterium]